MGLSHLTAAKISQEDALGIADQFLASHSLTRAGINISESTIDCYKDAVYIINNPSGGWVLVGADDNLAKKVLGYSKTGVFNISMLPDGARWFIEEYAKGISSGIINSNGTSFNTRTSTNVEPLLGDIAWNQYSPFNDLCPEVNGERSLAGCVNIAVAQIMRYYKYPEKGSGSHYYNWNETRLSVNFNESVYQWDLMNPYYTGEESEAEKSAVAKLIYDLAVANESYFDIGGTGASFQLGNFLSFFDYDAGITPVIRQECKAKDYESILRAELDEGRPVYVEGGSPSGGHSFVCDGYDSDGYFHYNFGWGADWNAYLLCSATGFDSYPMLTIGIKPNDGGLPGVWAATGDDVYWKENDYISCYFYATIYSGLKAEIEAGLAVEEKATGNVFHYSKTKSEPQTNLQVFGFDLNDEIKDGEYIVYPICRVAGGEWKRVYVGENASDCVYLSVVDGKKTYTNVGVGGEQDEGVVLIDGIYYRLNDGEATVTSRNSRGNSYKDDVVVPNSVVFENKEYPVTVIGEEAFKLSQLNTLIIGKNVRLIESGAFTQCHVDNLLFEEGTNLKELASWAFNLADIPVLKLPEGLEIINACAFRGEIKLLDLPSTINYIPSETVSCLHLTDLYLHWKSLGDIPDCDPSAITTDVSAATLHVPEGCTDMYRNHELWSRFGKITDKDSPAEAIKIDQLYYIIENDEAIVAAPVKSSEDYYSGDITIPDFVEYDGVEYPVTSIGEGAFKASQLKSLTVGNNISLIKTEAFYQCRVDDFMFEDGSKLKEVARMAFCMAEIPELILPKGLVKIGELAFNGAIEVLDIPSTVDNLPSGSISSYALKDLYVHWPSYEELPFYDDSAIQTDISASTLHVPEGCVDLYRQQKLWSAFGNITDDCNGVQNVVDDKNAIYVIARDGNISFESVDSNVVASVYSMQGQKIASIYPGMKFYLGKGVFILQIGNKATKIILQ